MKGVFVVTAMLAAACGARPGPAAPKVRVAAPQGGVSTAAVDIAQTRGHFDREGIAVEIIDVSSGAKAMEALAGGSADVIVASLSVVMQTALKGRYPRGFISMMKCNCMSLVASPAVQPPLRSVADLKGRTASVTGFGSSSHILMNWFLHRSGIGTEQVHTVAGGSVTAQLAALDHGRVDAAMVNGAVVPALRKRYPGLVILAETETPDGLRRWFDTDTFAGYSLIAMDEWLRANPGTARRFATAVTSTMVWMRSNPPSTILAALPPARRSEDHDADLQAIGEMVSMLTPDGQFTAEGVDAARRMLAVTVGEARMAPLDITKTYTNEFLKNPAKGDTP